MPLRNQLLMASVLIVATAGVDDPILQRLHIVPDTYGTVGTTAFATPRSDLEIPTEDLTDVVQQYCVRCHSDRRATGNLSLERFRVESAPEFAETGEKMIKKLRANMMPPPGAARPAGDTLVALVTEIEERIDAAAAADPYTGSRHFQRLNRAEYERSVRDLLGLEIDASEFLPPDQRSANFDNIADVQMMSPTLVSGYIRAAAGISRLAVGDLGAVPAQVRHTVPRRRSQREHVEGTPVGTRGGTAVLHYFPADGDYVFRLAFERTVAGYLYGGGIQDEQIEVSIDGERVAVLTVDPWMSEGEAWGLAMETEPIHVRAGAWTVAAAFLKRAEGPVEDLPSPHELSLTARAVGDYRWPYAYDTAPHLQTLIIVGPYDVTGVSETASRRKIFTCRPTEASEERPCAEGIIRNLAGEAFRGTLEPWDLDGLMALYDRGVEVRGFEEGVRLALQGILSSPKFVFRLERPATSAMDGEVYALTSEALASRLSYFLWNLPPDDELMDLARGGELSDLEVLEAQAHRMLEDPRSEALATRFASQWLRLHDLEEINPDAFWFPDFDEALREAMRRETELFFHSLIQGDRSLLELLTADYTFVNERLARHYGIDSVAGSDFRRVAVKEERRRGLLGHASVLTSTSFPNRTSIVERGKWVMEVLMGTPPPPPPPNVPPLEASELAEPGRVLTSKERQEMHTQNPVCAGCHETMDPIGLALENFDPVGRWRRTERRDMGNLPVALDTRGVFWDGSPVEGPSQLRRVLLGYEIPLTRAFTENVMTYALGRRVGYSDQPAVRRIVRDAKENGYRMSSFILGVVVSDQFRMMRWQETADDDVRNE